ncbi:MAG: GNAT family N-acetyltransferase [Bdellovibrionales bacterium]|nr:GNAT family N-acetyltransferase [Bdellovibrionales bacterium]
MSELLLRPLAEGDEFAFIQGAKLWSEDDLSWYAFDWQPGQPFAEYLARLRRNTAGLELPEGFVPNTMFYGFVDGQIVGRLHVRHRLSEALRRRGGHVGYAVAPPFRGRGYAQRMLTLALPICERLGIQDVMLTCGDENVASYRVIEACGGCLAERFYDERDRIWVRRYSIVGSKLSGGAG